MENTGKRVRFIRELEKQTRDEFCHETGMKIGTLRDLERGEHLPRFGALIGFFLSERYQKYAMWVIYGGSFDLIEQIDPIKFCKENNIEIPKEYKDL